MDDAAINTYLMNKTPPHLKPYNITKDEIIGDSYTAYYKRIHNIIAMCRLYTRDASFYPRLNAYLNNAIAATDAAVHEYHTMQDSPSYAKFASIAITLELLRQYAKEYRYRQHWPDCLFTELPRRN